MMEKCILCDEEYAMELKVLKTEHYRSHYISVSGNSEKDIFARKLVNDLNENKIEIENKERIKRMKEKTLVLV
jgi:hypothetical protein